jgi:homoserine dehydrogenase
MRLLLDLIKPTSGSAVLLGLDSQADSLEISRRVGVPIEIVRIADLDVTRDRGLTLPPGLLTTDAKQILADPAIDIVVELIGGCDVAKRIILEAIAAGKHVVTANKALLA